MNNIEIIGASRTPMGAFQGVFSEITAPILGGFAIKGALEDAQVTAVDEVLMGCVLSAGLGQAPAKQASFLGGLDNSIPATTVNKMCGSGMKTVMMAYDQILSGSSDIILAGGMESMTNSPYLLPKMRSGSKIGHQSAIDSMFLDGLEDAYEHELMGVFAEQTVETYDFTRQEQDEYALQSLEYALKAQKQNAFDNEIYPVSSVNEDQQPGLARPEKIPHLKPVFKKAKKGGTITPANASSISDGASALVLAKKQTTNSPTRATIRGHASYSGLPSLFPEAPIHATRKLLNELGWGINDVDLWEVNEAFAVVPMAFMKALDVSREKINVNGGACALGHPIGSSGSRVIVTLLNALEARDLKRGIATVCIGGGEATAIAIER